MLLVTGLASAYLDHWKFEDYNVVDFGKNELKPIFLDLKNALNKWMSKHCTKILNCNPKFIDESHHACLEDATESLAAIFDASSVLGEKPYAISFHDYRQKTINIILMTQRGLISGLDYKKGLIEVTYFAAQIRNADSDFGGSGQTQMATFASP